VCPRRRQGNWDCAKKILRNHGLRGIYSGYLPTLLRDMQGYAWFFSGYEATVHYLAGPGKTKADLDYMQVGRRLRRCSMRCLCWVTSGCIACAVEQHAVGRALAYVAAAAQSCWVRAGVVSDVALMARLHPVQGRDLAAACLYSMVSIHAIKPCMPLDGQPDCGADG
jgi:hypothetical protein